MSHVQVVLTVIIIVLFIINTIHAMLSIFFCMGVGGGWTFIITGSLVHFIMDVMLLYYQESCTNLSMQLMK